MHFSRPRAAVLFFSPISSPCPTTPTPQHPGHWRCPAVAVTSEAHRGQNLRRHRLTPSPPQHQSRSQPLPRHRQDLLPACRGLHPPPLSLHHREFKRSSVNSLEGEWVRRREVRFQPREEINQSDEFCNSFSRFCDAKLDLWVRMKLLGTHM